MSLKEKLNIAEIDYQLTAKHRMEEFHNLGLNLGNSGWTLPMDLSPGETQMLEGKIKFVNDILFSYYNEENLLKKMEEKLLSSKYLKENATLIKQIFIAYRQQLYALCISGIAPVIENLFANFTKQKKNINFKQFLKSIKEKIAENSIVEAAALGAIEGFINSFAKSTDFSQEQIELTRNNICHGRIDIPNSQKEAIRYIANLYNLSYYFSI